MKSRIFTSFIGAICLLILIGCVAGQRSGPNLSSPAYQNASPENRDRIARGVCAIGMSIAECRAAGPTGDYQFINAFQEGGHRYETWRMTIESSGNRYQTSWLYLEVKDGIIDDASETRKR